MNLYVIVGGQAQLETTTNLGSPANGQLSYSAAIGGQPFPTSSTFELDFVQN